MNIYGQ